jgi:hypothetical protein
MRCTWAGCKNTAKIPRKARVSGRIFAQLCKKHDAQLDKAHASCEREDWLRAMIRAIGFDDKGRRR